MIDTPTYFISQKNKYGGISSVLCIPGVEYRHWGIILLNHVEGDFSNTLQQCPVIWVGWRSWQQAGPPSDYQQFWSEHCSSHHPQTPPAPAPLWVRLFAWGCEVHTSDLANPNVTLKASSSCPTGDACLSASWHYVCHSHASVSLILLILWLNVLWIKHTQKSSTYELQSKVGNLRVGCP